MYQRIQIIGNIGQTPAPTTTPAGQLVTKFWVAVKAVNEQTKTERATWFRVTISGNKAGWCVNNLKKGNLVFVEGILLSGDDGHPRIKINVDGEPYTKFEIQGAIIKRLNKTIEQELGIQDEEEELQEAQS